MTDFAAVSLAAATWVGAWVAIPRVGWIGMLLVVGAFIWRRPVWLIVGSGLVASALGAHAMAGLSIEPGLYRGNVEVLQVASASDGKVHVEVRAQRRHLDLVAPDALAHRMHNASPGDRFEIAGRITPIDPAVSRGRGRHIAGRIRPYRIVASGRPRVAWRVAGAVRNSVKRLGKPLAEPQRALFEGFVLGDASRQSDLQRADFRASGLTHLLVASGANIAFVLLLAAPVLSRSSLRSRWAITVGLCVLYALVTGLEPSVLRAATMAIVAVSASGVGRPVRSWRSLAFAVTILVMADPFLVHAVGFGLSVGASIGILALARPLADALSGPSWLREPLAVTVSAQLGVAPLLLGFPGGMPVAALPANVLAAFPAGLVMVLGLPALVLVATGLPGTVGALWIPRILLGWVDAVATRTAALPLGYLGSLAVIVATVGLVMVLVAGRSRLVWVRRAGFVVAAAALVSPMWVGTQPLAADGGGASMVVVRRGGTVVVVLTGQVETEPLLTGLSVADVRRVDAVVLPRGDPTDAKTLEAIAHRHRIGAVITPKEPNIRRRPTVVVGEGDQVAIGEAVIEVVETAPTLSVHVADRPR